MRVRRIHPAGLPTADVLRLQQWLAARVEARGSLRGGLRLVAGVACSPSADGHLHASAVLCEAPHWTVIEQSSASGLPPPATLEGLASFREAPLVLEALRKLPGHPQVLLVGGHGRLHARRLGLASHVGLQVDVPTVGVGLSLPVGSHRPAGPRRGDWVEVRDHAERLGLALTTRPGMKPVYVSPGHRLGLLPGAKVVLACATRARLPEPLRQARLRSLALARSAGRLRRRGGRPRA